MRWLPALVLLAGCGGIDDTPLWVPPPASSSPVSSYAPLAPSSIAPLAPSSIAPLAPSSIAPLAPGTAAPRPTVLRDTARPGARYDGPQDTPSVVSGAPLTRGERRGLSAARQSLDDSIGTLERRARFRGDTAAAQRRLRSLKARRLDVLRRLRGG